MSNREYAVGDLSMASQVVTGDLDLDIGDGGYMRLQRVIRVDNYDMYKTIHFNAITPAPVPIHSHSTQYYTSITPRSSIEICAQQEHHYPTTTL